MVIVPDRHGAGTNALLLSPPDAIEPSFGPGSFARHAARAREAGVAARVAALPSLGLDVDTPDDLAALRSALATRPRRRAPHARAARDPAARAGVIALEALPGLPEVRPGDDLAALLAAAGELRASDVLVIAHKVVSKAEGRVVRLADVEPGERARALAAEHGKDPRQVEVILSETDRAGPRRRRPADLPHPPRLRVRQRGRRRVQRRRAGHAGAAARRPGRLGAGAARAARLRRS